MSWELDAEGRDKLTAQKIPRALRHLARMSNYQSHHMPVSENEGHLLLRSVAARARGEGADGQEGSTSLDQPHEVRRAAIDPTARAHRAALGSGGNKPTGVGGRRRSSSRLPGDHRTRTIIDPRIWIGRL